jgi:hypothetical protein
MLNLSSSEFGPRLPTWALQQVGSYLGYTGRDANVVAEAALDPNRPFAGLGSAVAWLLVAGPSGGFGW